MTNFVKVIVRPVSQRGAGENDPVRGEWLTHHPEDRLPEEGVTRPQQPVAMVGAAHVPGRLAPERKLLEDRGGARLGLSTREGGGTGWGWGWG